MITASTEIDESGPWVGRELGELGRGVKSDAERNPALAARERWKIAAVDFDREAKDVGAAGEHICNWDGAHGLISG
jgi:hypothetical protein